MLQAWQAIAIAAGAVLLLALWVRREHGGQAALVMAGLAAAALACVWVAYEGVPVEQWRKEPDGSWAALVTAWVPAAAVRRRVADQVGPDAVRE